MQEEKQEKYDRGAGEKQEEEQKEQEKDEEQEEEQADLRFEQMWEYCTYLLALYTTNIVPTVFLIASITIVWSYCPHICAAYLIAQMCIMQLDRALNAIGYLGVHIH